MRFTAIIQIRTAVTGALNPDPIDPAQVGMMPDPAGQDFIGRHGQMLIQQGVIQWIDDLLQMFS